MRKWSFLLFNIVESFPEFDINMDFFIYNIFQALILTLISRYLSWVCIVHRDFIWGNCYFFFVSIMCQNHVWNILFEHVWNSPCIYFKYSCHLMLPNHSVCVILQGSLLLSLLLELGLLIESHIHGKYIVVKIKQLSI